MVPYKAGAVALTPTDTEAWSVTLGKDGNPIMANGPCPYCGFPTGYTLPPITAVVVDLVGAEPAPLPPYDLLHDQTRQIACACTEDHKGRPATVANGCGATWQITMVHRADGKWIVEPGDPRMATAATALALDIAADELKTIRTAAEKWIVGVAAIYGTFSLAAALIAKSTVATLPAVPKTFVVVLAIASLVGAVAAIFNSYRAAYGWPVPVNVETDTGLQRWFALQQGRLPKAVNELHTAVYSAIGTLIALALAFGIVWLWPVSSSLVTVTYNPNGDTASEVSTCGQLTSVNATELKLLIPSGPNAGAATVPVAWLVTTAPATSC